MKPWFSVGVAILAGILAGEAFADRKGPEVLNIDQKISIHADAVPLDRLMQLWDKATGMHSTVPSELAGHQLNVHFSGLSVSDALRKIFDGRPFGYVLIEDGLVITPEMPSESELEPEPVPAPLDNDILRVQVVETLESSPEPVRQKPEALQEERTFYIPLSFLEPLPPPIPPAGAPNGPAQNTLFGPLPMLFPLNPQ
jgi:hypothetical protein